MISKENEIILTNHLASGDVKSTITNLINLLERETPEYNTMLSISAQFFNLLQNQIKGIIKYEDFNIQQNKIINSLLQFISLNRTKDIESDEFKRYLNGIIKEFEVKKWTKNYIDLIGTDETETKSFITINEIMSWSTNADYIPLFLIGDFGSGKTWTFKKACYLHANERLKSKQHNYFPIFISLGKIIENDKLKMPNEVAELCNSLKRQATITTLVFLDGFDELTYKKGINPITIINELISKFNNKTKFALSSRSQIFELFKNNIYKIDFYPHLKEIDETEWALSKALAKKQTLLLSKLSELDIDNYFKNSPCIGIWERIENKKLYYSFLIQPFLLYLFEGILPRIHELKGNISISDFYSMAIKSWILRDALCRNLHVGNENDWMNYLEELAGSIFPYGFILSEDVNSIKYFEEKEPMLYGLLHAGFLKIENRRISFAHESLFEFFFARKLFNQMLDYNAYYLSRSDLISMYLVNRYLVSFLLGNMNDNFEPTSNSLKNRILRKSKEYNGIYISDYISINDYNLFLKESRWRKNTGYGRWVYFESQDETKPSTDPSDTMENLVLHVKEFFRKSNKSKSNVSMTALSWYDAIQFCRWIGGELPSIEVLKYSNIVSEDELWEWTCEWQIEYKSHVKVYNSNFEQTKGQNPDLRLKNLGFRVMFKNE